MPSIVVWRDCRRSSRLWAFVNSLSSPASPFYSATCAPASREFVVGEGLCRLAHGRSCRDRFFLPTSSPNRFNPLRMRSPRAAASLRNRWFARVSRATSASRPSRQAVTFSTLGISLASRASGARAAGSRCRRSRDVPSPPWSGSVVTLVLYILAPSVLKGLVGWRSDRSFLGSG